MGVHLREKKVKGGKVSFYLDIYHNGKRKCETLNIQVHKNRPTEQDKINRQLAQQLRAKKETELIIHSNDLIDKDKQKTDFITWFEHTFMPTKKNAHGYSGVLYQLKNFSLGNLGDMTPLPEGHKLKRVRRKKGDPPQPFLPIPFTDFTRATVLLFQRFLYSRVMNNGVQIYIKNLGTALKAAVREGYLKQSPLNLLDRHERAKKQDKIKTAFTIEELSTLANTYPMGMHPQIKQVFMFSSFTGLRWCDANGLLWSEIEVKNIEGQERYFIHFDQSKTKGVEYLPLSPQAVEIIKERRAESKDEPQSPYVFPEVKEINLKTKRKWNWVKYWLKRWAAVAKIEKNIHYHCARHTFATNVLEHSPSGDLYTVSKLLGHTSIIATQIYAKVRDKRKAEAVDALPMLNIEVKNNENTPVVVMQPKRGRKRLDQSKAA